MFIIIYCCCYLLWSEKLVFAVFVDSCTLITVQSAENKRLFKALPQKEPLKCPLEGLGNIRKKVLGLGRTAHTLNPCTQEEKAGGSLWGGGQSSLHRVPGQSRLHSKTCLEKNQNKPKQNLFMKSWRFFLNMMTPFIPIIIYPVTLEIALIFKLFLLKFWCLEKAIFNLLS